MPEESKTISNTRKKSVKISIYYLNLYYIIT